jgi:hypothetical protein
MFSLSPRPLIWTGVASMVTFIGTLAAIPVIAARIPENYFVGDPRRPWGWRKNLSAGRRCTDPSTGYAEEWGGRRCRSRRLRAEKRLYRHEPG